jgi:hypothetical protein
MKVVNQKTGKWTFYSVEDPIEAVCLAYAHHEQEEYGITKIASFAKYPVRQDDSNVKCGDWTCSIQVNKWNPKLIPGCRVCVKHGDFRGEVGRITKDVGTRIPYVEGLGYVQAEYLQVY